MTCVRSLAAGQFCSGSCKSECRRAGAANPYCCTATTIAAGLCSVCAAVPAELLAQHHKEVQCERLINRWVSRVAMKQFL